MRRIFAGTASAVVVLGAGSAAARRPPTLAFVWNGSVVSLTRVDPMSLRPSGGPSLPIGTGAFFVTRSPRGGPWPSTPSAAPSSAYCRCTRRCSLPRPSAAASSSSWPLRRRSGPFASGWRGSTERFGPSSSAGSPAAPARGRGRSRRPRRRGRPGLAGRDISLARRPNARPNRQGVPGVAALCALAAVGHDRGHRRGARRDRRERRGGDDRDAGRSAARRRWRRSPHPQESASAATRPPARSAFSSSGRNRSEVHAAGGLVYVVGCDNRCFRTVDPVSGTVAGTAETSRPKQLVGLVG
jgi:hypothetical protein